MNAFDRAFAATLGHEGVLSTDRSDPGNYRPDGSFHGTKYGISARAYPNIDIAALTLAQAREIYRRDYWDALRLSELPDAIAAEVFDAAVNSGRRSAVVWLQRSLGVNADGILGPITLRAAREADPMTIVARLNGHRLSHLTDLATWPTFGRGWARRVASNLIGD